MSTQETKRDQDEKNLNRFLLDDLLLKDILPSDETCLNMITIIVKYAHENNYEYADMIEDTLEGLETFLINKEDQGSQRARIYSQKII
tara:strand:+ start:10749 stop:11012 length:264 start_codon:yes stop_codon:yes gene_type:complete